MVTTAGADCADQHPLPFVPAKVYEPTVLTVMQADVEYATPSLYH
jgi:hypothetical protein